MREKPSNSKPALGNGSWSSMESLLQLERFDVRVTVMSDVQFTNGTDMFKFSATGITACRENSKPITTGQGNGGRRPVSLCMCNAKCEQVTILQASF